MLGVCFGFTDGDVSDRGDEVLGEVRQPEAEDQVCSHVTRVERECVCGEGEGMSFGVDSVAS